MDLHEYRSINRALQSAGTEANITPKPGAGENVRFVTIETDGSTVQPASVLNALQNAGFIYNKDEHDDDLPALKPFDVVPGSITFEDKSWFED